MAQDNLNDNSTIAISELIRRSDHPELKAKIDEVNMHARQLCSHHQWDFIPNENIKQRASQ